jgi:hypothetical protein
MPGALFLTTVDPPPPKTELPSLKSLAEEFRKAGDGVDKISIISARVTVNCHVAHHKRFILSLVSSYL